MVPFFSRWNPFNLYGNEVKIDDIIRDPLQNNETLMQDESGCCRRIKTPCPEASLWEKFLFWMQIHLNQRGHLEAIDKLISLFQEMLLQNPPEGAEHLEKFNAHAQVLRSLKNDYAFSELGKGDPFSVEKKLHSIQKLAYFIFEYSHCQQALAQEKDRKKEFFYFQKCFEQKLSDLALLYLIGLQKARYFMVSSPEALSSLFEGRVTSFRIRLGVLYRMHVEINEVEKLHQGKFTIPFAEERLRDLRSRLRRELQKLGIELEMIIENLMINYQISPWKEIPGRILQLLGIDPDSGRILERGLEFEFDPLQGDILEGIERLEMFFDRD